MAIIYKSLCRRAAFAISMKPVYLGECEYMVGGGVVLTASDMESGRTAPPSAGVSSSPVSMSSATGSEESRRPSGRCRVPVHTDTHRHTYRRYVSIQARLRATAPHGEDCRRQQSHRYHVIVLMTVVCSRHGTIFSQNGCASQLERLPSTAPEIF